MIYIYSCPVCPGYNEEIRKTVSEMGRVEFCNEKHKMDLVIRWIGEIKKGDCGFEAHYNPAFGKVLLNPHQVKEEILREKGENGVDLVNIGTDKPYAEKRKKADIDLDAAGHELHYRLKRG